jgi:hypothetical protein
VPVEIVEDAEQLVAWAAQAALPPSNRPGRCKEQPSAATSLGETHRDDRPLTPLHPSGI